MPLHIRRAPRPKTIRTRRDGRPERDAGTLLTSDLTQSIGRLVGGHSGHWPRRASSGSGLLVSDTIVTALMFAYGAYETNSHFAGG